MKVRATLIELWKKITPYNESEKIYWNGENNDYSEEIERVVGNSSTGSRSREMFSKFIYGSGIKDELNTKFPSGILVSEIAKDVIDDIVVQNGAFIHTSYMIEIVGSDILFLPYQPKSFNYNKCRIAMPDDEGNEGMIYYKNWNQFDKEATRKKNKYERKYYPFNANQEVVKAQIKADAKENGYKPKEDDEGDNWSEMIKHYRGQVMYLNLTPKYRYAISKFDSVFNDLDTEYRIGVYFNTSTRGGFLGKMAVLTQGLGEEEAELIKENISEWLGAGGSADVYHVDVEQVESLDNVIKIINVPTQFNDKQFSVVQPNIRTNILGAANNLPEPLAFANSGAMFDSGEKYEQLKQFYWEQCEWERQKIEQAFYKLGHFINFLPINKQIKNDGDTTQ